MHLPLEILEHVSASLRDPIPVLEAANQYIDERYSDFSHARFALSAFSKVCSTVRIAVERVLYRDIQLDFTGWKGRKHPRWPAASLSLLLRTLKARPELGRYVHAAALDFQLSTGSKALEDGLKTFLEYTPNLRTLFLCQCPLALWDFPPLKTITFATTFAPGIISSILGHFPKLQNLYLRDCHVMNFSLDLPHHKLKTIRLDSSHGNAAAHISRALALCSNTVHYLDIRFMGGLLYQSPNFLPRIPINLPSPAKNLRSLRLDNISVFSHPNSACIQILQSLTLLKNLHVSNHSCFAPSAFAVLPPSLNKLTITDYYGYWEKDPPHASSENKSKDFLLALTFCIRFSNSAINRILASVGGESDSPLVFLSDVCAKKAITLTKVEGNEQFVQINFATG